MRRAVPVRLISHFPSRRGMKVASSSHTRVLLPSNGPDCPAPRRRARHRHDGNGRAVTLRWRWTTREGYVWAGRHC